MNIARRKSWWRHKRSYSESIAFFLKDGDQGGGEGTRSSSCPQIKSPLPRVPRTQRKRRMKEARLGRERISTCLVSVTHSVHDKKTTAAGSAGREDVPVPIGGAPQRNAEL